LKNFLFFDGFFGMWASGSRLAYKADADSFKINELEPRPTPESAGSIRIREESNFLTQYLVSGVIVILVVLLTPEMLETSRTLPAASSVSSHNSESPTLTYSQSESTSALLAASLQEFNEEKIKYKEQFIAEAKARAEAAKLTAQAEAARVRAHAEAERSAAAQANAMRWEAAQARTAPVATTNKTASQVEAMRAAEAAHAEAARAEAARRTAQAKAKAARAKAARYKAQAGTSHTASAKISISPPKLPAIKLVPGSLGKIVGQYATQENAIMLRDKYRRKNIRAEVERTITASGRTVYIVRTWL